MSKKGWGYGKRSMSISDKIRGGKTLKFENEDMKVYEYVLSGTARSGFIDLTIKYIDNIKKGKKTIVITGLHVAKNYDCSIYTNQVELFNHVEKLIEEYIQLNSHVEAEYFKAKDDYMYSLNYMNFNRVSEATESEFQNLINSFFNSISKFKEETRIKIWNNIYKDIFDRSAQYDNSDIVNLHCKYLDLVKGL